MTDFTAALPPDLIPPDRLIDAGQRYEVRIGGEQMRATRAVVWSNDLIDAEGLMKSVMFAQNAESASVFDRVAAIMVRREFRAKPDAGFDFDIGVEHQ